MTRTKDSEPVACAVCSRVAVYSVTVMIASRYRKIHHWQKPNRHVKGYTKTMPLCAECVRVWERTGWAALGQVIGEAREKLEAKLLKYLAEDSRQGELVIE